MQNYFYQNYEYFEKLLNAMSDGFSYKIIFAGFYGIFAFLFDPTKTLSLTALLMLVIFDTITGVSASYATKVEIESKKMIRSAFKICFYFLFVSAGHLSEIVLSSFLPIETTITAFLALTELVSIAENLGKLGYNVPQNLLNKIKKLKDEQ